MEGPSTNLIDLILDFGGIALSLLSITKRCVDWWMTRGPLEGPSPPFVHSLKAAAFYFLPHMLFRSTALAFSCRFLGYNAIWPICVIVLHTIIACFFLHKREENVRGRDGLFFSAVLSLFAPLALFPDEWSHRALMKRTILCKNIVFLFTFICMSLLPPIGILPQSWCLDTPLGPKLGLRSPCTETNLTWDDFAFPILPILVGLGIYCLIDSILSFWKDRLLATTRWPCPYRLIEM